LSATTEPCTRRPDDERKNRGRLRRAVRAICLAAVVAMLIWGAKRPRLAAMLPAVSPFVAAASILATRALRATATLGLAVGILAVVRRRWFCRWACPTGLCADGASRLGRVCRARSRRLPPLGQWILLATLGGACLGYPLLLWLDPVAMFSGLASLCGSEPAARWCAMGVPAVLVLSLLVPGAWCASLCPLGAMQDLLWKLRGLPRHSWSAPQDGSPAERGWSVTRRGALGVSLGVLWAASVRRVRAAVPRALRPPGAIPEPGFLGVCLRCGNCARACPSQIIHPDLNSHGLASLLTPVIEFREDYCREDCTRCMDSCPSGALLRLAAVDKLRAPLGRPRVDMELCLLGHDRDCTLCSMLCPYGAITKVFSEEDYTMKPQIDLQKCPGCGACEAACPTAPVKAIRIEPLGDT
jgi:ferredoxin